MKKQQDFAALQRQTRARKRARNIVVYALLTLWGVVVLFPFYWMILTSVKSYGAYNSEYIPQFFTLSPTLQNYVDAFTTVSSGPVSAQHPDLHRGHHGDHAGGHYSGGLRLRQTAL